MGGLPRVFSRARPALTSFLAKDRPLVVAPSIGITWRDIRNLYTKYYGIWEEKLKDNLRILVRGPLEEPPQYVRLFRERDWREVFDEIEEVVHSLAAERRSHMVRLLGIDALITTFGEAFRFLQAWMSCFKKTGGLAMWIAKTPDTRVLDTLSPMADMHFKITRRHGCLLLYGKKPETPLYAIQPDPKKSALMPKLIPIV